MGGCIFCGIASGTTPASLVHSDEHTVAFLDIAPLTPGHTLVIPREHHVDLFDIEHERAAQVMRAAVDVARRLEAALDPAGMNILHASRAAAWQSVFHFHLHVLPRFPDDALKPMFLDRAPASREELDAMAARIRG